MRFNLTLSPVSGTTSVPFNYQYALSAILYKKIAEADEAYAHFLHEHGYALAQHTKHFKLFTFSNLQGKFKVHQGALHLLSPETGFTLCCHMPEFATNVIRGVFADQQVTIAGRGAKAAFNVSEIQVLAPLFNTADDDDTLHTVHLKLLSPIVVGRKNAKGNDDYLSPEDDDFIPLLKINLLDKYNVAYGETLMVTLDIKVVDTGKIKSRLVTIKEGTAAETKVRGFIGFGLGMTATSRVIELAMDSGVGSMNAIGFGCVEGRLNNETRKVNLAGTN